MKRILLFLVVVGLFAGQASAVMYTLTPTYALTLDDVTYSDVGGLNIMPAGIPTTSTVMYGAPLTGVVGFTGILDDTDGGDKLAWVKMGDPGANLNLNLSSATDYKLMLANDNQDIWAVQLFMTANSTGTEYVSGYTDVSAFSSTTLVLNFLGAGITNAELLDIDDIGFYIRGDLKAALPGGSGYPSDSDTYHTSVVPEPATIALLGLGVLSLLHRRKK